MLDISYTTPNVVHRHEPAGRNVGLLPTCRLLSRRRTFRMLGLFVRDGALVLLRYTFFHVQFAATGGFFLMLARRSRFVYAWRAVAEAGRVAGRCAVFCR